MRYFARLLIVLVLFWLANVLFGKARAAYNKEDVDGTQVLVLFSGMLLLALVAGSFFVISFLPAIGEAIGNFFFSPNESIEEIPHSKALAALAQGDYRGAIKEYEEVYDKDPKDTLALSEIARIYCDKLDEPALAAATLERALNREWSADEVAFLSSRLVDVYWDHQKDIRRAREILLRIVEQSPGTRHAANANHRLHAIERHSMTHG